ncbi:MAG: DUF389 domain-containing protein [Ruminococcus sp.]|nr:DUF389 domain-containing protein [Ruminococcus sp.]
MSVKKYNEKIGTTVKRIFSIHEDSASHDEIRDRLISGGRITGTNMVVMVCAILIASVGLNTGSAAVIIGAMLISPLMGSILAIAYGNVSADYKLARNHLIGFLVQIGISVLAATVYFLISPVKEPTSELLARTSPSFFDVVVAIAGGTAGIVGQTRKDKSNNIIPGVAIATALMPPLCTCGYSIANGEWEMLGGAAYLFLVNSYFIFLSSAVVLAVLDIPKVRDLTEKEWKRLHIRMIRNTIIVLLPCIPIGIFINR